MVVLLLCCYGYFKPEIFKKTTTEALTIYRDNVRAMCKFANYNIKSLITY